MAETTWTEDSPGEAPKKRVPTWVWFCGAGCLAMIVLGIILAVFFVGFVKNATDPEKQWTAIEKILPYDERPAEMTPIISINVGAEQFTIHDSRGYDIQIQHYPASRAEELRSQLFGEKPELPKHMLGLKFESMTPGTVDVQGRELHVLRLRGSLPEFVRKMMPKEGNEQLANMLFADVTPEGRDDLVIWQMSRSPDRRKSDHESGPITDEEIRSELKPFRIGPKH